MIDPLGPDPNEPATRRTKPTDVISDFEAAAAAARLRPKVRRANYDSPEALIRPEDAPTHAQVPSAAASNASPPQAKPESPSRESDAPTPAPSEPPSKAAAEPTVIPRSEKIPVPKSASNAAALPKSQPIPAPNPANSALARPIPPKPGKLERAVGLAKTMLPIVGNLLPLLEGNVAGAAANLIANRQGGQQVDLKPMEEAIAKLQSDQRALTFHTSEQKRAIRRIEDEFATLQESIQKHAADQAELAEQVVKLAKRTSTFMRLVTILLVVSILFSALIVVRIAYLMHAQ